MMSWRLELTWRLIASRAMFASKAMFGGAAEAVAGQHGTGEAVTGVGSWMRHDGTMVLNLCAIGRIPLERPMQLGSNAFPLQGPSAGPMQDAGHEMRQQ